MRLVQNLTFEKFTSYDSCTNCWQDFLAFFPINYWKRKYYYYIYQKKKKKIKGWKKNTRCKNIEGLQGNIINIMGFKQNLYNITLYIAPTRHAGLRLRDYGGAKTRIRQSWRCPRTALTVAKVSGFPAVVSPGSPNCTPPGKTNSSTWNASQWIHETPRIPPTPRQDSPIWTMVRELLLTGAVVKGGAHIHTQAFRQVVQIEL